MTGYANHPRYELPGTASLFLRKQARELSFDKNKNKQISQDFSIRSMHFKNILKFILPFMFILVSETSAGCIPCFFTDQKSENAIIEVPSKNLDFRISVEIRKICKNVYLYVLIFSCRK